MELGSAERSVSASVSNVPMLIDTGADVTLVPRSFLDLLGIDKVRDEAYEVQGFDGSSKPADMVALEMVFTGKKFAGQFLVIDQPVGILGRNILNALSITLDGPRGKWDENNR